MSIEVKVDGISAWVGLAALLAPSPLVATIRMVQSLRGKGDKNMSDVLDLKEALVGAIKLGVFLEDAIVNKKLDLAKASAILPALLAAGEGAGNILPEAKALDAEGAAEILAAAAGELGVLPEKAKNIVLALIDLEPKAVALYKAIKG